MFSSKRASFSQNRSLSMWRMLTSSMLAITFFASPVSAGTQELRSDSYIVIRGTEGDPWLKAPPVGGQVIGGIPEEGNANVFVIVKADGLNGAIRSGSPVKIRGTEGDPWLRIPPGGGPVTGGPPNNASIFIIEKQPGSSQGALIRLGDQLRIRGTEGDPWLHVPQGGGPVSGGPPGQASNFVIEAMEELPPPPARTAVQSAVMKNPGLIQLGWMHIPRCIRVKWKNSWPKLETGEHRLYGYANVPPQSLGQIAANTITQCAAVGAAACGLSSLITSPASCVPTFTPAFSNCLTQQGGRAVQSIRLSTDTQCIW